MDVEPRAEGEMPHLCRATDTLGPVVCVMVASLQGPNSGRSETGPTNLDEHHHTELLEQPGTAPSAPRPKDTSTPRARSVPEPCVGRRVLPRPHPDRRQLGGRDPVHPLPVLPRSAVPHVTFDVAEPFTVVLPFFPVLSDLLRRTAQEVPPLDLDGGTPRTCRPGPGKAPVGAHMGVRVRFRVGHCECPFCVGRRDLAQGTWGLWVCFHGLFRGGRAQC